MRLVREAETLQDRDSFTMDLTLVSKQSVASLSTSQVLPRRYGVPTATKEDLRTRTPIDLEQGNGRLLLNGCMPPARFTVVSLQGSALPPMTLTRSATAWLLSQLDLLKHKASPHQHSQYSYPSKHRRMYCYALDYGYAKWSCLLWRKVCSPSSLSPITFDR